MLYNTIRNDLKVFMKAKDMVTVNHIRVILGEASRLNKKAGELPTDEEIIKILKGLEKNEMLVLEAQGKISLQSYFLSTVRRYLPRMMSKEEIRFYIKDNIDVNTIVTDINKVMGSVMKDLKNKADGGLVKQVLTEYKEGVFIV